MWTPGSRCQPRLGNARPTTHASYVLLPPQCLRGKNQLVESFGLADPSDGCGSLLSRFPSRPRYLITISLNTYNSSHHQQPDCARHFLFDSFSVIPQTVLFFRTFIILLIMQRSHRISIPTIPFDTCLRVTSESYIFLVRVISLMGYR